LDSIALFFFSFLVLISRSHFFLPSSFLLVSCSNFVVVVVVYRICVKNESIKSVPSNFQEGNNVGFEVIACPFASPVQLVSGQAYAFTVEFADKESASKLDMSALLAHCTDPFHPAFPGILSGSMDSANTLSGYFDALQPGGLLCFGANFTSNFHHLAEATRLNLSFVFMESVAEFQTHDHPEAKAETTALPLAQVLFFHPLFHILIFLSGAYPRGGRRLPASES
jgi:hypothetical protein